MCLDDRLARAAERGDTHEVLRLIEQTRAHCPGDAVSDQLQLALLWAAIGGQVETLRRLVERGADVNTPELTRGHVILVSAAREGQLETVKELLALGARPDAVDPRGWSAWEMAHVHGNREIADLLAAAEGGHPSAAQTGDAPSAEGEQKVYTDTEGRKFYYKCGYRVYLDGGPNAGAEVKFTRTMPIPDAVPRAWLKERVECRTAQEASTVSQQKAKNWGPYQEEDKIDEALASEARAQWAARWEEFISEMEPGDEIWYFEGPGDGCFTLSWRGGFALVREGKPVAGIVT